MPVYSPHRTYTPASLQWQRCRDAADGTDAVKKAGHVYLPVLEGQKDSQAKDYLSYVTRALFYPAMNRTVLGLLGLVFAKPAVIDGIPASFMTEFDDVTLTGSTLSEYAREVGTEILTVGRCGILLDMPAASEPDPEAPQDAPAAGAAPRPYWSTYAAETIVNWRTARMNGVVTLTMVVLLEEEEVLDPEDDFAPKTRRVYRVLLLRNGVYVVQIYAEDTQQRDGKWILEAERVPLRRGKPLSYIPFCFVNAGGIESNISHPPLLDLVDVNLSHYRTSADQEHGAHFTALPTPYVTGHILQPGEELGVGSGNAWVIDNPLAKVGMVEFSGAGLHALADLKEEKRKLMITLGARMLETQNVRQEAAVTVAMRHAGERSELNVIADTLSQALTLVMRWHLYWDGLEDAAIAKASIDLQPEVMESMSIDDVKGLVAAWQAGAISHKTLYSNLEWGEWTRQDVTFDEEMIDITEETPVSTLPAVDSFGNPLPVPPLPAPAVPAPVKKVA